MTKTTLRKYVIAGLTLTTMHLAACANPHASGVDNSGVGAASASNNEAIAVVAATSAQCTNGGSVYEVYTDANANGILDAGDTLINQQIVCNGANGKATLIAMSRVTTDAMSCASLSGLQISTGLDANSNGVLDSSEITQTSLVCDGKDGASGAASSNGYNMVFSMASASASVCPTGGTTILMALDTAGTGVYSVNDPDQQSMTICNGQNGQNGLSAAPTAYTPVEAIVPCGDTVANKEVLMRLENGSILADVSSSTNGSNTRLSFLNDGTYIDTDGSQCTFSIATSSDGSERSVSWAGKVQETWSITK